MELEELASYKKTAFRIYALMFYVHMPASFAQGKRHM